MAIRVSVEVRIQEVGAGTTGVLVAQSQSNSPGFGQSAGPGMLDGSQMVYLQDAAQVYGVGGSITLAEILTALQTVASDIAGASGTPLITADILATINGWSSGSP
jgi:hypothetical protein